MLQQSRTGVQAKRFRLNGWQRIGIIASVIWLLAGAAIGDKILIDRVNDAQRVSRAECLSQPHPPWPTNEDAKNSIQACYEKAWIEITALDEVRAAAVFAIGPILFSWVAAYLLLALFRWVRAGFKQG